MASDPDAPILAVFDDAHPDVVAYVVADDGEAPLYEIQRRPTPPWSPYSLYQMVEIPLTPIRGGRFDLIAHAQRLSVEAEKK